MTAGVTAPAAAYAVAQFRDPAAELARLGQQAAILALAEEQALLELGLPATGRALDVGCGPGFVAARIRHTRPQLEIIGVDRDPAMLRQARQLIPVTEGSAERLPFPAGSFDCVYARLVLRHLADPAGALREMHRVLRPSGRLIVVDSDDGALVMHPTPVAFARALGAREKTFQRRGADPFIGRRLPALLGAAEFGDLSFRPLVVDTVSVGRGPFARIVLAPVADAIDADLLDAVGVAAAVAAIDAWSREPAAFGMTTVVALGGSRR